jgi:hypothetical protein
MNKEVEVVLERFVFLVQHFLTKLSPTSMESLKFGKVFFVGKLFKRI